MTPQVLSDYSSSLQKWFSPRIAPQMNRSVPMLQTAQVRPGRGPNAQFVIETGTGKAVAFSDGADVTSADADTKTPATLAWAEYMIAFAITGRTLDAAASSGNPEDFADLFGHELLRAMQKMGAGLATAILTGDISASAPEQVGGLIHTTYGALKATGDKYGNIDKAAVTQFQGNELLNGGFPRALQLGLMREAKTEIYIASGEYPDQIWCSPRTHQTLGNLYGDKRRYMQQVQMRGVTITLDGGFNALDFDGIPVMMDNNIPDGEMLFLNSNHWYLTNLPVIRSGMVAPDLSLALQVMPEAQLRRGEAPLTVKVIKLATTGNAYKFAAYVTLQQIVDRPNAHARLGDIAMT